MIDVAGTPVLVPDRWPKYTDDQKAALCRMVQRLQKQCGDSLDSVHVTRSVRVGDSWQFHGGWTTRTNTLADDDLCTPITNHRRPRTWRLHNAQPKECYL